MNAPHSAILSLATTLLATALLLLPSAAFAETPDTPPFTGHYIIDEDASDDMHAAFEPALQKMGRVRRALARRHLRREVEPDQTTRIQIDGDSVIVNSGDRPTLRSKLDGKQRDHETQNGNITQLSTDITDDILRVEMESDDLHYISRYSLNSDGDRLTLQVNMVVDQLDKPVSYTLVYRRQ